MQKRVGDLPPDSLTLGSLASDANKGIAKIEYDDYGHPSLIQFTKGNQTKYVYGVDGTKHKTIHITAVDNIVVAIQQSVKLTASQILTIDSTDYVGNLIYENGKLKRILFQGGFVSVNDNNSGNLAFHYYAYDHLVNVHSVINESGAIEQMNNYYPFGNLYADGCTNSTLQPYKYNDKELDRMHGLDWYDYGARDYDATNKYYYSYATIENGEVVCNSKSFCPSYVSSDWSMPFSFMSSVHDQADNIRWGSNGQFYYRTPQGNIFNGNQYVGVKSIKYPALKLLAKCDYPLQFIIGAVNTWQGFKNDGNKLGYNTVYQGSSAVGGITGGWVGGWIGAKAGAVIGLHFEGIGAVPGAIIGGFTGGIVGSFFGSSTTESIIDQYYQK